MEASTTVVKSGAGVVNTLVKIVLTAIPVTVGVFAGMALYNMASKKWGI